MKGAFVDDKDDAHRLLIEKAVWQAQTQARPQTIVKHRRFVAEAAPVDSSSLHRGAGSQRRQDRDGRREEEKQPDASDEDDFLIIVKESPRIRTRSPAKRIEAASFSRSHDTHRREPVASGSHEDPEAAREPEGPSPKKRRRPAQPGQDAAPAQSQTYVKSNDNARSTGQASRRQERPRSIAEAHYPSPSSPTERPKAKQTARLVHREPQSGQVHIFRAEENGSAPRPHPQPSTSSRKPRQQPIVQDERTPPIHPHPVVRRQAGASTAQVRNIIKVEEDEQVPIAPPAVAPARPRQPSPFAVAPPPDPPLPPLERFFTMTCSPPLLGRALDVAIRIFADNGVHTAEELQVLASLRGVAREYWFQVVREAGLTMLWESVIRDGLEKLLARRPER